MVLVSFLCMVSLNYCCWLVEWRPTTTTYYHCWILQAGRARRPPTKYYYCILHHSVSNSTWPPNISPPQINRGFHVDSIVPLVRLDLKPFWTIWKFTKTDRQNDRSTDCAGTQKGQICQSVDLSILEFENCQTSTDRQQTDRQIWLCRDTLVSSKNNGNGCLPVTLKYIPSSVRQITPTLEEIRQTNKLVSCEFSKCLSVLFDDKVRLSFGLLFPPNH